MSIDVDKIRALRLRSRQTIAPRDAGEQQFELAGPLPTSAAIEGETRVIELVDKGPGRGLLFYYRTEIRKLADDALSGDYNPMHALRSVCGYEPARIRAMTARFTTPVFPGETLRTELWHAPGGVLFRTRIKERDRIALDNGFAALAEVPQENHT